jgi:hypothetical protein
MHSQQALGDLLGMARTAGALAELMVAARRGDEAAAMLVMAVQLNLTKGALIGLQHNRAVFSRLEESAGRTPAVAEAGRMLDQAEAILSVT